MSTSVFVYRSDLAFPGSLPAAGLHLKNSTNTSLGRNIFSGLGLVIWVSKFRPKKLECGESAPNRFGVKGQLFSLIRSYFHFTHMNNTAGDGSGSDTGTGTFPELSGHLGRSCICCCCRFFSFTEDWHQHQLLSSKPVKSCCLSKLTSLSSSST